MMHFILSRLKKTTIVGLILIFAVLFLITSCSQVPPPKPVGPLPSERQLAWHEMEFYAFIHFNMNTFTDMEWGYGSESPGLFNPSELDCRQWARVCKEAGMKGIILTAKHHDGFCLWPSKFTEHSVKNSPWKNGEGDVVRELSDACKEYGLKLGLYLSPWDRNNAAYGTPEYITYYRNQLHELLTDYGEIYEFWRDGANGGTGWYGGADENRYVNRKTYYDWGNTMKIIRKLQPKAVIFSDAGPDIRWVGNESGWAGKTNWSILRRDEFYPGSPNYKQLTNGHEDGTHWVPTEVDVSIRPGWYYHKSEDHKVKSLKRLVDIYYHSIGRNGSFLLNLPVDARGLIHENDVIQLKKLADQIKEDFAVDLTRNNNVTITADNIRGNDIVYYPERTIDEKKDSYWTTDDDVTAASITIDFGQATTFNRFLVQEYIPLGQRVKAFTLEVQQDDVWKEIASETTIGVKRILRFEPVIAKKLRLNITQSKACPVISNIGVFNAPKLLEPPVIMRNKKGMVSIDAQDQGLDLYYTTDNTDPKSKSIQYTGAFLIDKPTIIKAVAIDPANGKMSPAARSDFDISKALWEVISVHPGDKKKAWTIIDDNPVTAWTNRNSNQTGIPGEIIIDLGEPRLINGFTYLPPQGRYIDGTVSRYEIYVSLNGKNWGPAISKGEFSNIKNNPVLQKKRFKAVNGRYIKFRALSEISNQPTMSIAEFGILTK